MSSQSNPDVEEAEELCESEPQSEEEPEAQVLDLMDVKTAAEAAESLRRSELEEARRLRLERLDDDAQAGLHKILEITEGWAFAKEEATPRELQEALNSQQQLCSEVIEAKKNLINTLQDELKNLDDQYVENLGKQALVLDMMRGGMKDQPKVLTKLYGDELEQIESIYQLEYDIFLKKDETEKDQFMKDRWEMEESSLMERKKIVEEYEVQTKTLQVGTNLPIYSTITEMHDLEREFQKFMSKRIVMQLQGDKTPIVEFANMKNRMGKLVTELYSVKPKLDEQNRQLNDRTRHLFEEYISSLEQYECAEKRIQYFAVADAKRYAKMRRMLQAEVKRKVERALDIDYTICNHLLGLPYERPSVPVGELLSAVQLEPGDAGQEAGGECQGPPPTLELDLPSEESSTPEHYRLSEFKDTEKDKAYWEGMGNAISEEQLKLWQRAESTLRNYVRVLRETSDLYPETQGLARLNTELRMLLHEKRPRRGMDDEQVQSLMKYRESAASHPGSGDTNAPPH